MMYYYSDGAKAFFDRTVDVKMGSLYSHFLPLLPKNARVLDAGCGSGRDSKFFAQQGFNVTPLDASPDLATLAEKHTGLKVQVCKFQEIRFADDYDAVWACASLLHVPERELPSVFLKLWKALKEDGILYCSFKYGNGERFKDGRHFTDANEERLKGWLGILPGFEILELWCTQDQRLDAEHDWLNAVIRKPK